MSELTLMDITPLWQELLSARKIAIKEECGFDELEIRVSLGDIIYEFKWDVDNEVLHITKGEDYIYGEDEAFSSFASKREFLKMANELLQELIDGNGGSVNNIEDEDE